MKGEACTGGARQDTGTANMVAKQAILVDTGTSPYHSYHSYCTTFHSPRPVKPEHPRPVKTVRNTARPSFRQAGRTAAGVWLTKPSFLCFENNPFRASTMKINYHRLRTYTYIVGTLLRRAWYQPLGTSSFFSLSLGTMVRWVTTTT